MKADPEFLLGAIEPYRPNILIGVECVFTWYWMSDLCAEEGLPFVLDHALYMKAESQSAGGKKNSRASPWGMFPMAKYSC